MPRLLVRERVRNARNFVRRESHLLRNVVYDVKSRVVHGHEPSSTRHRGGGFGKRGSLLKSIPAFVVDTMDNIAETGQTGASINRHRIGMKRS